MTYTEDDYGDEWPRDRWGRPIIVPPGSQKGVGYRRPSTLCKMLDDTKLLTAWQSRMVAVGLELNARDRDAFASGSTTLRTEVARIIDTAEAAGETNIASAYKKDLDKITEAAKDAAGAAERRDAGTDLHNILRAHDEGTPLADLPQWAHGYVNAYTWALAGAGLRVLEWEVFVVHDGIQTAGSMDLLLLETATGRVLPGDVKTGRWDVAFPAAVTRQVAIYANSERFDKDTGARSPIHPEMVTDTGVLVHVPYDPTGQTSPAATTWNLDLIAGWEDTQQTLELIETRNRWGRKESRLAPYTAPKGTDK